MSNFRAALRPAVRSLRRLIPRHTGPVILVYHRIADERFDPWGLAVSPAHFAEQVEWLSRNRRVLPLNEFAAAHEARRLAPDAAAITFDDGYACTFTTAAPVLEKLGLPATVFVPPAAVSRGGEFWWDELERLVMECTGAAMRVNGAEVKLGARSQLDRDWRPFAAPRTARQKAFRKLWSLIRAKNGDEVQSAMADLRRQAGDVPPARESHRVATRDEIRSSKIDIGGHGLTHASLPSLDAAQQGLEIEDGKALLAQLTGKQPTTFAYPFGDRDTEVEQAVKSAGFLCACCSRQAPVSAAADMFALPRVVVENGGAGALERMLVSR